MTERYSGALVNDANGLEALARVSNPMQTAPELSSIMKPVTSTKYNNPVNTITASPAKISNKLDRMLEQQMINDILRANGNLKSLKAFRVASEKLHKDKALEEVRRKEIREPLEDALVEIDLLQGKLQRRDEMIKILRKQALADTGKGPGTVNSNGVNNKMSSFEEARQYKQMILQEEENKLVNALDKVEQYKIAVNILQKEIHKLKRIIDFQQSKLRDAFAGIEEMEFRHNEQIKRLEGDKQIYLNMVDNRENRIEKLMEDKDNLTEELADTKSELQNKSQELKQLKEKFTDLQTRFDAVNKAKIKLESNNFQLNKDLKISREETRILEEKHDDLLVRYDKLVLELDKMVEEGQFIPDPNALMAENSQLGRDRSSSINEKRRSKGGVRLSDVHRAVKVNTKNKVNSSKKIFEESTISTDSDDEESSDMLGQPAGNVSAKGSISGPPPARSASISNPYVPSTLTMASMNSNTNIIPAVVNQVQPSSSKKDLATKSTDSTTSEQPQPTFVPRGQGGGRFSIRKFEEDALAIEKIASNSAIRMKDTLAMQIKDLESKLKYEQDQRELERKKAMISSDSLQNEQRHLLTEVERLNSKINDMDKFIADLKDELSASKTANYLLLNGQDNMRVGSQRSALLSRLSHSMPTDAHYEGYIEPMESQVEEEPPEAEPHPETSITDEIGDEELVKQHNKSQVEDAELEDADKKESGDPDDENYMQVDMLAYIYDWENVNKHSKETQIDMDIVSTERQVQYEVEDFMNDKELEQYHAEQAEIASMRMDRRFGEGYSGKKWVGKEVVIQRDEEFYYQLEQLYQSFLHICQHVMPKHKMELLNFNFAADYWQSKLINQQLLIGLDIQWQVKYALALITAFNEMRNEFVRKFGHASEYMSLFERSSESDPSIPEDDLRVTLAIRLIDVIIQSLHHILSPMYHIGQSHYPELEKVRAETPIPPMPPHYDSKAHLAELHEHISRHQDPEAMIETLQEHARMILDFVDRHDDKRPQTFPLTETLLSADAAGGSPKGILNTHQESVSQKLKYYMGQSSPRNLPTNIDEVLDMIERRSRSGTPVGRSRSPSPSPINRSQSASRSPSRGRSASPACAESRGHSRGPLTESPTAEQIIKHYINEAVTSSNKAVSFSIDGSLIEEGSHVHGENGQRSTRQRSTSPYHRQPFTSGLLRTLKSREKETTNQLVDHSQNFLDYTRLTFDKSGVASAPYHFSNVQPSSRAKSAGAAVSSSLSDSLNSNMNSSSTTSRANAIPPPSLESILASSKFSAFRAHTAGVAVSKSSTSRRSKSPPRVRGSSPLKFYPTELDAIQSVASSTSESDRPIGFPVGFFVDGDSQKMDLSLSNSLIIPKAPQQQIDLAGAGGRVGRGGRAFNASMNGAKIPSTDAEDLLPQTQTPAPMPITPLFFNDSRVSTATGTAVSRAGTAGNATPAAPRQSTAPTIPHAKFGAASQRSAPARASRPQSSTPSAKYYSPRINRAVVFPQADTVNCALADTSVMVNIMEDPRIIGSKARKEKDSFFVVNTTNDETLSINGQRRNISSGKEKVTGASLYI